MGVGAAIFESAGKRTEHYVPGVYSRSGNVSSPGGVSAGNLVLLGSSSGGEPLKLMKFASLSDARAALSDGDLLRAVGYAFNGSSDYIPQKVLAMRVNGGTRATAELGGMRLTAADWGEKGNNLAAEISTESDGSVALSVRDIETGREWASGNARRAALTLKNNGADAAAVSVADGILALSKGGEDKKFTLSEMTVGALAAAINAKAADITCAAAPGRENDAAAGLDNIARTAIEAGGQAELESTASALAEAAKKCELLSAVGFNGGGKPSSATVNFTGGATEAATVGDWNAALAALETEDVQIIATPSSDPMVRSLIANHCDMMGTTEMRRERTCILGGPSGMTDAEALEAAKNLNSKCASFVCDGATAANPLTGAAEAIDGAMVAVMLAGMESAMGVATPLTNKQLKVFGFARKRTLPAMGDLIAGGVMACGESPDNPASLVCIRAVTTFQGDGDLISCERSMVREDLYMNRELRAKFAGRIGSPSRADTSSVIQTLLDAAADWARSGYIIPDGTRNVWNVKVRVDGDKTYLDFDRYLAAPVNFIFVTATNHVYTASVEI